MHVGSLFVAVLVITALSASMAAVTRPSRYLSNCKFLANKLPHDRLSGCVRFATALGTDAEFMQACGGLTGIVSWLASMATMVCLLQVNVHKGAIPLAEVWDAYQDALAQTWYSLWALPEAAMARFWNRLSHPAARAALECHYRFSLSANILLGFEGAPDCISNSSRLL